MKGYSSILNKSSISTTQERLARVIPMPFPLALGPSQQYGSITLEICINHEWLMETCGS